LPADHSRAPGCDRPATACDIDHVIAFADGGPTHPSNLSCYCRTHHLLKTFWGWQARQLPDGTLIWTLPGGHTYLTTPGSAQLFPTLCVPTGPLPLPDEARADRRGDPTAMMPLRKTTRAENRAKRIQAERRYNRQVREALQQARQTPQQAVDHGPAPPDDDPPPF
jgi:hypothetical protein